MKVSDLVLVVGVGCVAIGCSSTSNETPSPAQAVVNSPQPANPGGPSDGVGGPVPAEVSQVGPDAVLRFNEIARNKLRGFWREIAIMHAAMHDTVNLIVRVNRPYLVATPPAGVDAKGADAAAAAASAARAAIKPFLDDLIAKTTDAAKKSELEGYAQELDTLHESFHAPLSPSARATSLALGEGVAKAILAMRSTDNYGKAHYAESTALGKWRADPGVPNDSQEWVNARPWVVCSAEQHLAGMAPPSFSDARYKTAYNEVRCKGRADAADGTPVAGPGCVGAGGAPIVATQADRDTAFGWDISGTSTVERAARELIAARKLHLWDAAKVLARTNLAMADGSIGGWTIKNNLSHWRPNHAIAAGLDGAMADDTPGETAWEWRDPSGSTGFPEYFSGNVAILASGFAVLEHDFGLTDGEFKSLLPGGLTFESDPFKRGGADVTVTKASTNLWEIVRNVGESRILMGQHFRFSVEDGLAYGKRLGRFVAESGVAGAVTTDDAAPFVDASGNRLRSGCR